METLSKEEIMKMPLMEKIARMDEVIRHIELGRYPLEQLEGGFEPPAPMFTVKKLSETKRFSLLDEKSKTKSAWMCFEFLLQHSYLESYFAFQNLDYWQETSSPRAIMRGYALTQAIITGSRIQFEQLMNFLYFTIEGKEFKQGTSKKAQFEEWAIRGGVEGDLFCLMPIVALARLHDDKFRTAEVHQGSKLKQGVFALTSSIEYTFDYTALVNVLGNSMNRLLPIFNDSRPKIVPDFYVRDLGLIIDFQDWNHAYKEKDVEKLEYYHKVFKNPEILTEEA